MRNQQPSQRTFRKVSILIHISFSLVISAIFFYYGLKVEVDKLCFSSGEGIPLSYAPDDDYTNVSRSFNVVIYAIAITYLIDALIQIIRVTEVFYTFQHIVVILMLFNFLAIIASFISMHIYRFRPSGSLCSVPQQSMDQVILEQRGSLLKTYIVSVWSFVGSICCLFIILAVFCKQKRNHA